MHATLDASVYALMETQKRRQQPHNPSSMQYICTYVRRIKKDIQTLVQISRCETCNRRFIYIFLFRYCFELWSRLNRSKQKIFIVKTTLKRKNWNLTSAWPTNNLFYLKKINSKYHRKWYKLYDLNVVRQFRWTSEISQMYTKQQIHL